jgi:hypothetical protein
MVLHKFDAKGVRAFVLASGSNFTNAELLAQYTSTDGTNITFVFEAAATNMSATSADAVLYYNVQPLIILVVISKMLVELDIQMLNQLLI